MGFLDFLFKREEHIGGDYNHNDGFAEEPKISIEDIDGNFLMVIEEVFSITGKGTVATGRIASGTIKVGDTVKLKRMSDDSIRAVTITGVEMFRKVLDSATAGDNVGLLLRGVTRDEIGSGDTLFQGDMLI